MFIEVIICLAAIAACVWVLITAVKTVFGKIKLAARELKQAEDIEKRYADAIMSKYVKNGKVPSWAYDQLLRELKAYCNRAEHLSFSTYFDNHKPEAVKLPEDFKLTTSASRNQLTEACVVRFRDFDLENYSRSGQLSDYEQETMVYLSRMWFFQTIFAVL